MYHRLKLPMLVCLNTGLRAGMMLPMEVRKALERVIACKAALDIPPTGQTKQRDPYLNFSSLGRNFSTASLPRRSGRSGMWAVQQRSLCCKGAQCRCRRSGKHHQAPQRGCPSSGTKLQLLCYFSGRDQSWGGDASQSPPEIQAKSKPLPSLDSHYAVPPALVQTIAKIKELKRNCLLCATGICLRNQTKWAHVGLLWGVKFSGNHSHFPKKQWLKESLALIIIPEFKKALIFIRQEITYACAVDRIKFRVSLNFVLAALLSFSFLRLYK